MTYARFLQLVTEDTAYLDTADLDYARTHTLRYYETYKLCARYLKRGDKVLSIGAGLGSIEKVLRVDLGVEVTVIDFPESIARYQTYFDFLGFTAIGADLSADKLDLPANYFNMLLCSEVVEHVPLSPYDQFRKFDFSLAKGGKIVITTPNHGSIMHIAKVAMMMPVLESPEKTFSNVAIENQGVHRREYFPRELVEAFHRMGYRHVATKFFFYKKPKNFTFRLLYLAGHIIPRLKFGMMVVGEKM